MQSNRKNLSGLSTRDRKILLALLDQLKPISTEHLANSVSLSSGKVRYSVNKIATAFRNTEIQLVQKPNEGILLIADNRSRKQLRLDVEQLRRSRLHLNAFQRKKLIIQLLLTTNGISISSLIQKLSLSSTTFYRDLKEVKTWLHNHGIKLVTDENKNLQLIGTEFSIRNTIQEILLSNIGENYILQSCILPIEKIQINDVDRQVFIDEIKPFINSLQLPICEKQIRYLEDKNDCQFLDRVHVELALLLGITVSRIKDALFLSKAGIPNISMKNKNDPGINRIFQDLNINFQNEQIDVEKEYFSYLVTLALENGCSADTNKDNSREEKSRIVAEEIVRESAKYFFTGLNGDQDLINCIEWELSHNPGSNDSDIKELVGNSLNNQIYKLISPILQEFLENDFTDKSFIIANHIRIALEKARLTHLKRRVLLVCGAGMATAYSLKSQINTRFPQIEICGILSAFELAHSTDTIKDCDAVISTIPLGDIIDIPQIQVNTFLSQKNIEEIENILELKETENKNIQITENTHKHFFPEILTCKTIRCQVSAKTPQQVIEISGQLLLNKGAIWPSYIKAMKDLYDLYGPYMVMAPNTAFFHAGPEMGAKKLSLSIVTLHQPVIFNHKDYDPVKIAIAFSSPHHSLHTRVLSEVFSFFTDEQNRCRIINANQPQEIRNIIGNYFKKESLSQQ